MSKRANSGELRTPVFFCKRLSSDNSNAFETSAYENVYGADLCVKVKWVNAHGTEAYSGDSYRSRQRATITLRYSQMLDDETLVVFRYGDEKPWEIVSIDNVEMGNQWLEIALERSMPSR